MAPDYSLPLRAIVLHCVCELKDAFKAFDENPDPLITMPDGFPKKWSASIVLTPKVDTDFNARAGLTGTSKGPNSNTFFNTWALGTSPGAGIDFKSNKSGSLTIYVHGKTLLDPMNKLDCGEAKSTNHALAQDFGIKEWLDRLMHATGHVDLDGTASLDKPVFAAEITIKMDATGSFTYNFPFGTDFGLMGGWYQLDEQISIAFARDAQEAPNLVEFPPIAEKQAQKQGKRKGRAPFQETIQEAQKPRVIRRAPQGVSPEAKSRLDNIQLEQTLRSLQLRP
jgi:hypothetical protein